MSAKYQYAKAPNQTELSVYTGIGTTELDLATLSKDVPCQAACPAHTDVPAYIRALALGQPEQAYRINQEDNVFPAVLGRTCSRPCEDACRHNWTNTQGPVAICHLKRSGADHGATAARPLPAWFKPSGRLVAVVGGGPAGLTAARELSRYGHRVTLYEREYHLGGMMIDGIPRFRLPKAEVEREIQLIVDGGIQVRLGQNVDAALMEGIIGEFDAVLVATGTVQSKDAGIAGTEDLWQTGGGDKDGIPSIIPGLGFMKAFNDGGIAHLDGDVVVVGGGFTAVDCARACARAARRLLGVGHRVSIAYRRGEGHMAADLAELEEIRSEGIDIRSLLTPLCANSRDGVLESVTFTRNHLVEDPAGTGGAPGKPRFEAIPDSEFDIPCRHLIVAIGQDADVSILPAGTAFAVNAKHATSHPKVFTAGDFRTGSLDVIHAVAEGKAAAATIDRFLTGEERLRHHVVVELIVNTTQTGRTREHDLQRPLPMPLAPLVARVDPAVELEQGFGPVELRSHATRCYQCNHKFEIDQDKCIQCNWCIEVTPRNCIKRVSRIFRDDSGVPTGYVEASTAASATFIYIDSDECIRCGACLRVCPTKAISLRRLERVPCGLAGPDLVAPARPVTLAPRSEGGAESLPGTGTDSVRHPTTSSVDLRDLAGRIRLYQTLRVK